LAEGHPQQWQIEQPFSRIVQQLKAARALPLEIFSNSPWPENCRSINDRLTDSEVATPAIAAVMGRDAPSRLGGKRMACLHLFTAANRTAQQPSKGMRRDNRPPLR